MSQPEHGPIYLDYNASTPIGEAAAAAMLPFLQSSLNLRGTHANSSPSTLRMHFGCANPSASHALASEARGAVERARNEVAIALNCAPEEVYFTSGGTESNNWALRGVVEHAVTERLRNRAQLMSGTTPTAVADPDIIHVVSTVIEHPAVTNVLLSLESRYNESLGRVQGVVVKVDFVSCNAEGFVEVADVIASITDKTVLVSIMAANNEVGSVQPVTEIVKAVRQLPFGRGIVVHSDASQAVGKVEVDFDKLGIDLLTIAGHKVYAPKGVGALIVRPSVIGRMTNLMIGAGHERGLRAGTENIMQIVGLGAALQDASEHLAATASDMSRLRWKLIRELRSFPATQHARPNVMADLIEESTAPHLQPLLPNTLSIYLPDVDASTLLGRISDRVACTAGSACHSGTVSTSPVLAAMGLRAEVSRATLRLSVGKYTTEEDVVSAARIIASEAVRATMT